MPKLIVVLENNFGLKIRFQRKVPAVFPQLSRCVAVYSANHHHSKFRYKKLDFRVDFIIQFQNQVAETDIEIRRISFIKPFKIRASKRSEKRPSFSKNRRFERKTINQRIERTAELSFFDSRRGCEYQSLKKADRPNLQEYHFCKQLYSSQNRESPTSKTKHVRRIKNRCIVNDYQVLISLATTCKKEGRTVTGVF